MTASSSLRIRWLRGRRCARGADLISASSSWFTSGSPRPTNSRTRNSSREGAVFRWIRRAERETIPQVDGIVYVSRWARDALVDWFPEADEVPSVVIGCPVTPLRQESVCEPLGDLVTIGNLDIVKNHRFLLRVLAEANRRGRRYTLDVFGEGPLRKELLRQTRELGLEGQVRFRGFQPDARRFLSGYRAYVHAGYSESFCLAIVEGMAAGLPVVVGDIGPIPELCEDGVEGRFWPLDDVPGGRDPY